MAAYIRSMQIHDRIKPGKEKQMKNGETMNRPIILFGAGKIGKQALDYYGRRNVHFFADNHKAGLYYFGVPVISAEDLRRIYQGYHIIISTAPGLFGEIKEQLERAGISGVDFFVQSEAKKYIKDPRLEKFANGHKGMRCFIIGNGPSLRTEDLDKIAQYEYISFACNKIYKIFEQTHWRPDYYFASDAPFIAQNWDAIMDIHGKKFFAYTEEIMPSDMLEKLIHGGNAFLFNARHLQIKPNKHNFLPVYETFHEPYPSFSQDAASFVYEGFNVVYLMMQWAAYMGFAEIYLLGVDHYYAQTCNYFEQIVPPQAIADTNNADHFCGDYYKVGELIHVSDVNSTEQAYKKAELYSREHGFRIYNATRGGKLEVFERVDFDGLFK